MSPVTRTRLPSRPRSGSRSSKVPAPRRPSGGSMCYLPFQSQRADINGMQHFLAVKQQQYYSHNPRRPAGIDTIRTTKTRCRRRLPIWKRWRHRAPGVPWTTSASPPMRTISM
uniref:(northern house mosquito) hypothetical protein n=1 Tax=Culex pipiens TaxID=7175 RepID=A0A8D8ETZ9_CULPI